MGLARISYARPMLCAPVVPTARVTAYTRIHFLFIHVFDRLVVHSVRLSLVPVPQTSLSLDTPAKLGTPPPITKRKESKKGQRDTTWGVACVDVGFETCAVANQMDLQRSAHTRASSCVFIFGTA